MRRRDAPGLPDPENIRGPFGRTIAIVIVLGAFVAAAVGYVETKASQSGGASAADASELALDATRVSARDQERALSKLLAASVLAEQQVRRANALRLADRSSASRAERAAARREARRWAALATGTEALVDDPAAADPDDHPASVLAASGFNADRLWGQEDAARREAGAWGRHIASYGAILTIIAVALYLLGLSLTFMDETRVVLAALGCGLLLVGGGWAAWEARGSPERPSDEAAMHYALARRLLVLGDYRRAREHFEEVRDLRPDFGQAAQGHATAIFLGETSQTGAQYPSLVPPDALEAARDSLTQALDADLRTYGVVATLGFYSFLGALERDDPRLLLESIELTRDATRILPADPAAYYNLGVALLASGDTEGADAAYDDALQRTLDRPGAQELVAGALTDLTLIEGALDDDAVRETARALKARIVGAVATRRLDPRRPRARIVGPRLAVSPASVRWSARFEPEPPSDAALWVQWYRHDDTADGWGAIAAVSGPAQPRRAADGSYSGVVALAAAAGDPCLASGRYRAELYVDGTLAGAAETIAPEVAGAEDRALIATVDRLLPVSLCRPEGWRRARGLGTGYVAPAGASGIYVARSSGPVSAALERLRARLPLVASAGVPVVVTRSVVAGDGSRIVALAFGPPSQKRLVETIARSVADHDPVSG